MRPRAIIVSLLRDIFESASRLNVASTSSARESFERIQTTQHRSVFLTFRLLIIGHDCPGGNQRAEDVVIAPSNPVGVLRECRLRAALAGGRKTEGN